MALFTVRATTLDKFIADKVSADTDPELERAAEILTWGADEHILCAVAGLCWLATRHAPAAKRQLGNHILACTLVATILPHILKKLVDQERPDRETETGHLRGVPWSGKRYDAFPSGHAVHMGVMAGVATLLPSRTRYALWAAAGLLSATRVALLAHWFTDVAAGLGIGLLLERCMRPLSLGSLHLKSKIADVTSGRGRYSGKWRNKPRRNRVGAE